MCIRDRNYTHEKPVYPLTFEIFPAQEDAQDVYKRQKKNIATYPWTSADAPITIRSKAYRLPGWTENRNSTGSIAYLVQHHDSPEPKEYDIELIPYGCSTLRITLFPVR